MAGASWALSLSFIVLTVAFHTTGVVIMAFFGMRIRARVQKQKLHPLRVIAILTGVIGAVAVMLAVLHWLEAMLWAAAYLWLGAFVSYIDALIYSLGTMMAASPVELGSQWQMVSALEAMDGALLFGISTAFIFTVMQRLLVDVFPRTPLPISPRDGSDCRDPVAQG